MQGKEDVPSAVPPLSQTKDAERRSMQDGRDGSFSVVPDADARRRAASLEDAAPTSGGGGKDPAAPERERNFRRLNQSVPPVRLSSAEESGRLWQSVRRS